MAFHCQVGIEHEEFGVAIAEGVRPFGLDAFWAVFRKVEHLEVHARVAALVFVVADGRDNGAVVVYTPGTVEKAVPVIALVAAID